VGGKGKERGKEGRENGMGVRLGYLSRGPDFLVTPLALFVKDSSVPVTVG